MILMVIGNHDHEVDEFIKNNSQKEINKIAADIEYLNHPKWLDDHGICAELHEFSDGDEISDELLDFINNEIYLAGGLASRKVLKVTV